MSAHAPAARSAAPSGPVIMDIEASGFGAGSYPIEVGIVLADGSSASWLIRPEAHWTRWDASAEAVHGIARAQLLAEGWSARVVAQELNRRLAGQTVFTDGWAHDFAWLAVLFDAADLVPRFRLEHLRRLLNDEQARCWKSAYAQQSSLLGLQAHRAAADALTARSTLLALR
ncbi:hypothetical protein IP84_09810 [beta proteobacterium AAP99]|nr:hypothetical protein IP84_09810 [beta proteobacterium AAP99]